MLHRSAVPNLPDQISSNLTEISKALTSAATCFDQESGPIGGRLAQFPAFCLTKLN